VGAGQAELVTQGVHQQQSGLDVEAVLDPIHVQAHVYGAQWSLLLEGRFG
jgi:hypothetical protein